MTPEARTFAADEYRALRREIELRIILQNVTLISLAFVFSGAFLLQVLRPDARYQLAAGYSFAAGMLSLYWIHSGARTLQIKTYLRYTLEPRLGGESGWETWHDVNRVQGALGSRWFISTKGVLVGSQITCLSLAWIAGGPVGIDKVYATLVALAVVSTAILLRRPRLSPEAYRIPSASPL
ncbi:hypothetical protein [Phenylobacterium sp.]|uniref:hypothetical protein n=1 Tax=Phenylobacterium sp. TaxID=1871053 RepID=UPI00301CE178